MMRPVMVEVSRAFAMPPMATYTRTAGVGATLTWVDGTVVTTDPKTWGSPAAEVGFRVERAPVLDVKKGSVGPYTVVGQMLANQTTFNDISAEAADGVTPLSYRVVAYNAAGDSASMPVLVGPAGVPAPAAPTALTGALQFGPLAVLTWADNSADETGFALERATDGGAFVLIATPAASTAKTGTYTDAAIGGGHTHVYRIRAVNGGGSSIDSNLATVAVPSAPAAPSNLTATAVTVKKDSTVTLKWLDNSASENGFTLEWATDLAFTTNAGKTAVIPNATTATVPKLLPGTVYYFRLRAFNIGGTSAWTSVAVMTPP